MCKVASLERSAMELKLKELREQKQITQNQIAKKIGITIRRYGAWERGERNFNFIDAIKIADALGCSLDELAGRQADEGNYTDPRQERINHRFFELDERGKNIVDASVSAIAKAYIESD